MAEDSEASLQRELDLLSQMGAYEEARKTAALHYANASKTIQDNLKRQLDLMVSAGKVSKQQADLKKKQIQSEVLISNQIKAQNALAAAGERIAKQQLEAEKYRGKTLKQIVDEKKQELKLAEQLARMRSLQSGAVGAVAISKGGDISGTVSQGVGAGGGALGAGVGALAARRRGETGDDAQKTKDQFAAQGGLVATIIMAVVGAIASASTAGEIFAGKMAKARAS